MISTVAMFCPHRERYKKFSKIQFVYAKIGEFFELSNDSFIKV
jgi:hypothetical protein